MCQANLTEEMKSLNTRRVSHLRQLAKSPSTLTVTLKCSALKSCHPGSVTLIYDIRIDLHVHCTHRLVSATVNSLMFGGIYLENFATIFKLQK